MAGNQCVEAINVLEAFRALRHPSNPFESKVAKFDLVKRIHEGRTLLVGEGNLSFTKSLVQTHKVSAKKILATTYEHISSLNQEAFGNAIWLETRGVEVIHGVNATNLQKHFEGKTFNTILFQFPHTGKRKPVSGRNPNHVLVKRFLKSAKIHLVENGLVCISHVANPHYNGAFQFSIAATLSGYLEPLSVPFYRTKFPGYCHMMTNNDEGALMTHRQLATTIFRLG